MLFVLRDHSAAAHGPLPALAQMIRAGLTAAWASLEKPPRLAQAPFERLFAVAVHALPHKLYEPVAFDAAVVELRARFVPAAQSALRDCLVAAESAREKLRSVELGALFAYLRGLWGCVAAMRELDIASQKESLTAQICEKAYEDCCTEFSAKAAVFFNVAFDDWGVFGVAAEVLFGEIAKAFDEKAFPEGSSDDNLKDSFKKGTSEKKEGEIYETEKYEVESVEAIRAIRKKWRQKLRGFMAKELKAAQNGGKRFYERMALKEHKMALSAAMTLPEDVVENFARIIGKERRFVLVTLDTNLKGF